MRLGISLTSSHSVADPREGARRMIERAAAAAEVRRDDRIGRLCVPTALPRSYLGSPLARRPMASLLRFSCWQREHLRMLSVVIASNSIHRA